MNIVFGILITWSTIAHISTDQDLNCSTVLCQALNCSNGFVLKTAPDSCCSECVPVDNSTACLKECPLIKCAYGSYIPEGKCCPTCCSGICPRIRCLYGSYVSNGRCCPVCITSNCTEPCPLIKCASGSYTPEGKCCPECYFPMCRDVLCPDIACSPEAAVRRPNQCCPIC